MPPRLRLLHDWTTQVTTLLAEIRVTQARTLALFTLGVVWAGRLPLRAVAATLPLAVADASSEQRLRRWLSNERVEVTRLWRALVPTLLASRAGQEVLLVLDPTPHNDEATVLMLGLVCRRRVLPVAWRLVPQQTRWPERQIVYCRQLLAEVAAALPPDCAVTVVGDRGLPSAALLDACRAVGFHALFRLSADAKQGHHVRPADGRMCSVWELVTGPGQRWSGPVELFKAAGWRAVELTIRWAHDQTEPWLLVSTRPAGGDRIREYRRRAHAEAAYADCKRRGWDVERSRITQRDRLERLLLVLHLAYWWTTQLGLRALRQGERWRYDRAGRRDLSLVRIGRAALADHLDRRLTSPPLPFRATPAGWIFTWLA